MKMAPKLSATAGLLIAVVLTGVATPAVAADDQNKSSSTIVEIVQPAAAETSVDVWTPERMAKARSMEPVFTDSPIDSSSTLRAASAKIGFDENGDPIKRETVAPNVGRLFFVHSTTGEDWSCTATVVDTDSGSGIITAGHCLHGGEGSSWHDNMTFAPGYDERGDVDRPYGTFPVQTKRVFANWAEDGGDDLATTDNMYDVGFATVGENEFGQTPEEAVGGASSVRFDIGGFGYYVNIFGYQGPSVNERPYQYICRGKTGRESFELIDVFITMNGCGDDFGKGTSGGPWLAYKSADASDFGTVLTVTSIRYKAYENDPWTWGGIFFDGDVERMMLDSELDYDRVEG